MEWRGHFSHTRSCNSSFTLLSHIHQVFSGLQLIENESDTAAVSRELRENCVSQGNIAQAVTHVMSTSPPEIIFYQMILSLFELLLQRLTKFQYYFVSPSSLTSLIRLATCRHYRRALRLYLLPQSFKLLAFRQRSFW